MVRLLNVTPCFYIRSYRRWNLIALQNVVPGVSVFRLLPRADDSTGKENKKWEKGVHGQPPHLQRRLGRVARAHGGPTAVRTVSADSGLAARAWTALRFLRSPSSLSCPDHFSGDVLKASLWQSLLREPVETPQPSLCSLLGEKSAGSLLRGTEGSPPARSLSANQDFRA